jgi:uncharacterized protein YecE (DUF72 family)
LPPAEWLRYYATIFDTVEVNNTFYRLPEASTFAAWREQTPESFLMAVKASRFLTHMKRLRDPAEPIHRLFSRASALNGRLGPILYQLPANFLIDLRRLEQFLDALPKIVKAPRGSTVQLQHVMEFRHPSWYVAETFQLLERKAIALCLHDKDGSSISEPFVGPCAYLRFHGTSGRYHGSYSSQRLDQWAHRLVEQWQTGRPVYAYFNNDPDAVATENARTLKTQIDAAAAASSAQGGSPTAPTAEQAPPLRSQFVH